MASEVRHTRWCFSWSTGFQGQRFYSLTWALQYVNLFMINVGYIILAGQALKAVYVLFKSLPYFIAIAGVACGLFAIGIPHLCFWLGFSTFFSLGYIVIAFALSLKDGIKSPSRDYDIPGSKTDRTFTTFGASANHVFAFNTGMLPEIQATVRKAVVSNMMKASYFQFTLGVLSMYAVTFIGYWAYGSSTSTYLLNSGLTGHPLRPIYSTVSTAPFGSRHLQIFVHFCKYLCFSPNHHRSTRNLFPPSLLYFNFTRIFCVVCLDTTS